MATYLEQSGERVVTEWLRQTGAKSLARSQVVTQAQVTTDDMLEESHGLSFHELIDHVAQDGPHSIETFVGVADVGQTCLVQKNLLHDEDSDCLREFRACFHDTQTERYDLGGQKEVDNGRVVVLLEQNENRWG